MTFCRSPRRVRTICAGACISLIVSLLAGCASVEQHDDDGFGETSGELSSSNDTEAGFNSESDLDADLDIDSGVEEGSELSLGDDSDSSGGSIAQGLAAEELGLPNKASQGTPGLTGELTEVTDIRYLSRSGGGTVVIETSGPAVFRKREIIKQNQIVIDIANSKLPDRLKRPFLTRDFGQAVASVNAYQSPGANTSRVVITFKAPTRTAVTQSGRRLMILATGAALSTTPPPAQKGMATSSDQTSALEDESLDDASELERIGEIARSGASTELSILPESSDLLRGPTKFYGKPISLEVSKSSIRDVITLIAEQSGANIVLSSDVEGDISLKLKQIPWDQALMVVMKSKNLGYVRQGSILRVAPLKELEQEAEAARKMLEAQRDAEPLKVKIIPVSYASVDDLASRLKPFLTKRGQVAADSRTSALVVTDTEEILERAHSLVKALDTPPLQVLIEGKVIEATDNFTRAFGIRWGFTGQPEPLGGNLSIQRNNLSVSPGISTGTFNYDLRLGTLDIFGDLDASLSLLERENQVRIVSSPRVVTMNNKEATITQKTNIFYPAPQQAAASGVQQAVTFSQVEVPLTLRVKPQVTNDGDVIMEVNLTRSFAGIATPGAPPDINQRSATTNVMVRDGQTAVIGGVYQSDVSESDAGVPWLRKIPVLGWLFRSKGYSSAKNELLLFLTPRIINPDKSGVQAGTL